MRKLLLLGAGGQVGRELGRSLSPLGRVTALGSADLDFREPERVGRAVRAGSYDVVVNAAAYTAVDQAETDGDTAMRVNASAVDAIAREAAEGGALLVHFSTDYVFDGGHPGAYTEDHPPNPLNVYGRSKAAGDEAIARSGCRHFILRTSWVYGAHGQNFAHAILRLARERDALKVVSDQVGAPTSAELLADVAALCIALTAREPDRYPSGIYNVAPSGAVSWHGYARYVVEVAARLGVPLRLHPDRIEPIPSSGYPTTAKRPLNSRLATAKLCERFGLTMPDWKVHLDRFIAHEARELAP